MAINFHISKIDGTTLSTWDSRIREAGITCVLALQMHAWQGSSYYCAARTLDSWRSAWITRLVNPCWDTAGLGGACPVQGQMPINLASPE